MNESNDSPSHLDDVTHSVVYRDDEEYCSWPFNVGMWVVNDEVLVAFINHECDYSVPDNLNHGRIETFGRIRLMRSSDGVTWEDGGIIADNPETTDSVLYGEQPTIDPHNFDNPETLLTCWSSPNSGDDEATAWIRLSDDAGASWSKPLRLPGFTFPRIQGRPSYVVRDDGTVLLMLTARSETDPYDRPVVYASYDGGVNWTFLGYIAGSDDYRMICPSPVILEDGTLLAAVRCKPSVGANWVEVYTSDDGGLSWEFLSRVNEHGEPGHLTLLEDGRLLCVYGYRHPPFGIRCKISADEGQTWGREWILRDDGANYDLGYPRARELPDGRIVTSYYFNTEEEEISVGGGVRHIAATVFEPPIE